MPCVSLRKWARRLIPLDNPTATATVAGAKRTTKMSKTFIVGMCVDFEMDETEATTVLADPFPIQALNNWLNSHYPHEQSSGDYCLGKVREALGKHLAEKAVNERKQLPAPNTVDV